LHTTQHRGVDGSLCSSYRSHTLDYLNVCCCFAAAAACVSGRHPAVLPVCCLLLYGIQGTPPAHVGRNTQHLVPSAHTVLRPKHMGRCMCWIRSAGQTTHGTSTSRKQPHYNIPLSRLSAQLTRHSIRSTLCQQTTTQLYCHSSNMQRSTVWIHHRTQREHRIPVSHHSRELV
jgi:hypothetical protein